MLRPNIPNRVAMDYLEGHRQQAQRLQDALDRLMALHGQIYDLQGQIVALSQSDAPDKVERVTTLKKKVNDLLPEIERARQQLLQRKAP